MNLQLAVARVNRDHDGGQGALARGARGRGEGDKEPDTPSSLQLLLSTLYVLFILYSFKDIFIFLSKYIYKINLSYRFIVKLFIYPFFYREVYYIFYPIR